MKELKATSRRQTGSARAFTLTELLVVMGVGAMLAAVLLSASFTTQERVLRAECVSNLRQIGVGLNVFATENDDFLPSTGWVQGGNPWETHEVMRYTAAGRDVATGGVVEGPYAMGSLFFSKIIPNGQTFYCPSVLSGIFWYGAYTEPGWP